MSVSIQVPLECQLTLQITCQPAQQKVALTVLPVAPIATSKVETSHVSAVQTSSRSGIAEVQANTTTSLRSEIAVQSGSCAEGLTTLANQGNYKMWIYCEESGNNPQRWNSSGCLGLGQACPASKLLKVCPDESYACEDAWFTNYMLATRGSWKAAYLFHVAHGWW